MDKKRRKPNIEEGMSTELSSCKMPLITRHMYLQVESHDGGVTIISGDEFIQQELRRKFDDTIWGFNYQSRSQAKVGHSFQFTISRFGRKLVEGKTSGHEVLKMEIIRLLAEDGFKIMSTVFDPTGGENGGKNGAEKHMMYKELLQPTNQSGTDEASVNN